MQKSKIFKFTKAVFFQTRNKNPPGTLEFEQLSKPPQGKGCSNSEKQGGIGFEISIKSTSHGLDHSYFSLLS